MSHGLTFPAVLGMLIVGTSAVMAQERTMKVENRTYSFQFSEKLRFVERSVIAGDGLPQTTWEFRTLDWTDKAERGVLLTIIEGFDDFEEMVQRFKSDDPGPNLEVNSRTLFFTSAKGGVIMAAKSRCAEPCMLLILTGFGPDPESRSLAQEMIASLKASLLADNFLSVR